MAQLQSSTISGNLNVTGSITGSQISGSYIGSISGALGQFTNLTASNAYISSNLGVGTNSVVDTKAAIQSDGTTDDVLTLTSNNAVYHLTMKGGLANSSLAASSDGLDVFLSNRNNSSSITLKTANVNVLTAKTTDSLNGKVGINKVSPQSALDVNGNTLITGTLNTTSTISSSGNITTAGDLAVNGGDITSTAAILNINAGGTLAVQDNLIVSGSLSASGNATIDTSNDVFAALRITQRGTGHSLLVEDTTNPDSSPFVIDNAGNVGVGTSTISSKLNVAGDILVLAGNSIWAGTGSATRPAYSFIPGESNNGFFRPSADTIAISTNGVERARVTSTGNFGIGTNNPNTKLDVNGNAIITGSLSIIATGSKNAELNLIAGLDNYGGQIVISNPNTSSIGLLDIYIHNDLVSQLKYDNVDTTLNLITDDDPTVGPSISLRSSAGQLFRIQSSDSGLTFFNQSDTSVLVVDQTGNVRVNSGKGIDFSAVSNPSEVLDDYEEGTWTPVISGSTTAGSFTYERSGFYTKIGNIVYLHAYINVTAVTTTPTGSLRITGIPFASPSFRSTAIMLTDLRGTTGVTVAQGNIAGSVIQIWKNSIATNNLLASDLSPASGLSIVWSLNGYYRV